MRHCVDFVAELYPAYELKYNDSIFMQKTHTIAVMTVWRISWKTMQFHAFFHDPLPIRKWHCRDASYSALADIDILRTRREYGLR